MMDQVGMMQRGGSLNEDTLNNMLDRVNQSGENMPDIEELKKKFKL